MTDRDGRSRVHYAALEDRPDEVRRLVAEGSDPNAKDRNGYTPLHFAAQEGSVDVAEALLASGADVDPIDAHGNTPLWRAVFVYKGDGELIRLLRRHGADPGLRNRAGKTPLELARLIANVDVAQHFADLPANE